MAKRPLEGDAAGFSEQSSKRSPWSSGQDDPPHITIQCRHRSHEPLIFTSHESYEAHIESFHNNRCVTCNANLPTRHFLELHLSESHDPFTSLARERGQSTYACFVESCDQKFRAEDDRSRHLVFEHGYPRDYAFSVVHYGLNGRHSLLQSDTPQDIPVGAFDQEPDATATSLAKLHLSPAPTAGPDLSFLISAAGNETLQFVPRSVRLRQTSAANGG